MHIYVSIYSWMFEFFFSLLFCWAQSFSAVVGPNGSGKSNVIDAMLFVFGKRAKQVLTVLRLLFCSYTIKVT